MSPDLNYHPDREGDEVIVIRANEGKADGEKGDAHRRRKGRPCGYPPLAPTNVTLTIRIREHKTHPEFQGRVRWDKVTTNEGGRPTNIERYEVQLRATDAGGTPVDVDDVENKPRRHKKRTSPPKSVRITAATIVSGTTARFTTAKAHGFITGDKVVVSDMTPAGYNGTWTLSAAASTTFDANIGTSPADSTEHGIVEDSDDFLHVIFTQLSKPKTWYQQTRVRAVNRDGCAGDWSAWTTPQLPNTADSALPPMPGGLSLDFDKVQKHRRQRWMGKLQWNEVVNFDYPGSVADDEDDVDGYAWQIQISEDGVAGDDYKIGGRRLAKDADPDSVVRQRFWVRNPKWWFRARVRCIDRFNRRGPWTDWTSWQRPTDEAPPQPTNVRIFDRDNLRVPVEWDAPLDPTNGDLIHVDIDHFDAEWSTSSTFSTTYKKRRLISGQRSGIKVPKEDLGPFFYARVRSVNSDGEKSAWIPATIGGNSSPGASPSGVKPGRSRRIAIPFTKPGEVIAKTYGSGWTADQEYTIVGVRARLGLHDGGTHPNDGTPGGADMLINLRITDDSGTNIGIFTQDNRLKIDAGTHKDTNWIREDDSGFNRDTIAENETVYVKVAQVGSSRPGSDLVVMLILETND